MCHVIALIASQSVRVRLSVHTFMNAEERISPLFEDDVDATVCIRTTAQITWFTAQHLEEHNGTLQQTIDLKQSISQPE